MTKQILVIKHGALGDIIQGLDAFASLRAGFAEAHISVMTSPQFAGLMASMPYFDEVIEDERAPFWHVGAARRLKAQFQRPFDIIIDMQCSKRTQAYHAHLVPRGQRWLGTAKGCSDPYPDFTGIHNRDRMLASCDMLGCDKIAADLSFLSNQGVPAVPDLPSAYAVLMPGCSAAKPSKKWPAMHFSALARALMAQSIVPVVVGTNIDQADCAAVCDGHDFIINLCGKTNLAELASLCAGARLCVGNDSGPVFLAAKTGAPTIMVMGPDTNPSMSAPTGPRADYITAPDLTKCTSEAVVSLFKKMTQAY